MYLNRYRHLDTAMPSLPSWQKFSAPAYPDSQLLFASCYPDKVFVPDHLTRWCFAKYCRLRPQYDHLCIALRLRRCRCAFRRGYDVHPARVTSIESEKLTNDVSKSCNRIASLNDCSNHSVYVERVHRRSVNKRPRHQDKILSKAR